MLNWKLAPAQEAAKGLEHADDPDGGREAAEEADAADLVGVTRQARHGLGHAKDAELDLGCKSGCGLNSNFELI